MCKFRLLHLESVYFLQSLHSLNRLFGSFIQWKMSSNDELSSDTSSSCDAELLQLAVEGEGSFNSIVQRYRVRSWRVRLNRVGGWAVGRGSHVAVRGSWIVGHVCLKIEKYIYISSLSARLKFAIDC